MPRPRSMTKDRLAAAAMRRFWTHGYAATSLDDLVRATGSSRHAIYADFDGKLALYLAGFDIYQRQVVTPAFAPVETDGADLASLATYFETQIGRAEADGLPGPGCLVANAMSETAPHDAEVAARVAQHNRRLRDGFVGVLGPEAPNAAARALGLLAFTNGLWSLSRVESDADSLRAAARAALAAFAAED